MLASCIMPTRGRPEQAANALASWRAQTYEPRELVIVDDLDSRSFDDSVLSVPGVRYIWQRGRKSIGTKRNIACGLAAGEVIIHWDDDDLSAPGRIADQVARLGAGEITGYNRAIFASEAGKWRYSGREGYAIGSSLCYRRSFWQRKQFENRDVGEDNAFLEGVTVNAVDAAEHLVVRVHPGQTNDTAGNIAAAVARGSSQWEVLA